MQAPQASVVEQRRTESAARKTQKDGRRAGIAGGFLHVALAHAQQRGLQTVHRPEHSPVAIRIVVCGVTFGCSLGNLTPMEAAVFMVPTFTEGGRMVNPGQSLKDSLLGKKPTASGSMLVVSRHLEYDM